MRVGAEGRERQAREMERAQIEMRPPRGHAHALETERRGPPREVGAGVRAGP
jgi:hypothetical protein